ncbi:ABC transporter permease [Merismopedia glauca]|uniref:ABC transporter permease n=1 Tax=Merismopedia glauca CCAP 1448/3 TaxID=1296344 RepID=A0A2T1C4I7_9CYAN|nr:ABC transporter permease subunit [Merismopedia glauca]PSB03033.1 ABC transporter permease [Merismopedia glauca CCAP 1448/3]
MSLVRIGAIATNGFREVIRDRILYLIGLFAIFMMICSRLLPEISAGTTNKILPDLGLATMTILAVIVTIFVGTGLINKEIEKKTVLTLIPKPVSRAEFIIGKHLGLAAVLAVLVASMMAIYLLILTVSGISYPIYSLLVAAFFLFLELCLIAAAGLMFGVFTSSILATLLSFAIYLIGHLSQDMVRLSNLTQNPSFEQLTNWLYLFLPNLSRLDLKNDAVYGVLPPADVLWSNALYGVVYTVLFLAIATIIFSRREF